MRHPPAPSRPRLVSATSNPGSVGDPTTSRILDLYRRALGWRHASARTTPAARFSLPRMTLCRAVVELMGNGRLEAAFVDVGVLHLGWIEDARRLPSPAGPDRSVATTVHSEQPDHSSGSAGVSRSVFSASSRIVCSDQRMGSV